MAATLSLQRKRNLISGRFQTLVIEVNGRVAARLRDGDRMDVSVDAGTVFIKVKGDDDRYGLKLDVTDGQRVNIEVGFGPRTDPLRVVS